MNELNLVGLHEDGESLVLECAGQRYTLRIDDALRAAVRRDRPQLERAREAGTMPVREIQARIRAGATAEEVAELAGMSVDRVHRYDGPVLAEREHVVSKARASLVAGDGSPVFDELVTDRLAARGVDPGEVQWDSARDASGEWKVSARFTAGGTERSATWRYDAGARAVIAVDDEARWLSETETDTRDVLPRSGTSARESEVVRAVLSPVDARDATPDALATDALLDDLGRRRGQRSDAVPWREEGTRHPSRTRAPMTIDLPHVARTRSADDDASGGPTGDQRDGGESPAAESGESAAADEPEQGHDAQVVAFHPRPEPRTENRPRAASTPAESEPSASGRNHDDEEPGDGDTASGTTPSAVTAVAAGERPATDHVAPSAPRRGRRSRTKIPSWDEIMFGSRPEQ